MDTTLFSNDATRWSGIEGGAELQPLINAVQKNYNPKDPSASIPELVKVARAIEALPASRFKESKLKLARELIAQCAGLWFEANTGYYEVLPGSSVKIDLSFLNRSDVPVEIGGFSVNNFDTTFTHDLKYNRTHLVPVRMSVDEKHPYTEQYWLREPPLRGRFVVEDQQLRGLPESEVPFTVEVDVTVAGYSFEKSFR